MAKITRNPLPAPLRPEDFGGREALICTVKTVKVDVPSEQGKRGKATFMELYEFPGKGLYLNETSKAHAVEGFASDETDTWLDKKVPLVVVNSTFEDRTTHATRVGKSLWVAPPADWKKLLRDAPKAWKVATA